MIDLVWSFFSPLYRALLAPMYGLVFFAMMITFAELVREHPKDYPKIIKEQVKNVRIPMFPADDSPQMLEALRRVRHRNSLREK